MDMWLFRLPEETPGFEVALVLCSKTHAVWLTSENRVQRDVVARFFCYHGKQSTSHKINSIPHCVRPCL